MSAGTAAANAPTGVISGGIVYRAAGKPGSLVIRGSSTFHKWSITTHGLSGFATFALGKQKGSLTVMTALKSITLNIGVLSLRGSDGRGMDKTIYTNLKSKADPTIVYKLSHAVLTPTPGRGKPDYYFKTRGTLTAAGVSKNIMLVLAVLPRPGGRLSISTHTVLTFREFGISPPTALLGIIRADNKLKVQATWNLAEKSTNPTAAAK